MIHSRFFLTRDFHHRSKRRDGTEDLLVVPAGIELKVIHVDCEQATCTLPEHIAHSLEFKIPIDSIDEHRYETRLIDTRPLISSGLFVGPVTEEG